MVESLIDSEKLEGSLEKSRSSYRRGCAGVKWMANSSNNEIMEMVYQLKQLADSPHPVLIAHTQFLS